MLRVLAALVMFSAAAMTAAAWTQAPIADEAPQVHVVKMIDVSATEYVFEPKELTVKKGDTVRFEQTSSTPHNVEFRELPDGSDPGDQKMGPYLNAPGETYDVVIDDRFAEGVHNYVCTPHEFMGMTGSITVE